jgi:hypothetical protein
VVPTYHITLMSPSLPEGYEATIEAVDRSEAFQKLLERPSTPLEQWIAGGWASHKVEPVREED